MTGETPVVDVQSARQQTVLSGEVVRALPASRGYGNYLAALPAIQATGFNNSVATNTNFFTARGGRANEGAVQIDGLNVGSPFNGGGVSNYAYDMNNSIEVQVSISGGLGEADRGAPTFNIIPKTGGNSFSGNVFGSWAGQWGQSSNIDDELRALGFAEAPALLKNWDANFSLGGPIKRDKHLVLRQHAHHGQLRRHAEPVRERERRQRRCLDLGQRRGRARPEQHEPVGQRHPRDQSGHPAQQGGVLLRLHDELQRFVGRQGQRTSAAARVTTGRRRVPASVPAWRRRRPRRARSGTLR